MGQEIHSEYDAWDHMCADAFDRPRRGLVAVLTAYLDASNDPTVKGRPNRPLLHAVGCYLGYREDWNKVRREWREELNKKGLNYFHMTDFEWSLSQVIAGKELPTSDPYHGWNRDDFLAFQKRLYRVLNRKTKDGFYRLAAFCCTVNKTEFDAKLPDEIRDEPECQSYYIFNVATLMKQIGKWCNAVPRYKRDPIHYIFANGDGEGGNLENWFNFCWKHENIREHFRLHKGYSRIGYDMQWMEAEPALQAADIAAFELGKVGVEVTARGHSKIQRDELRKSLPMLFQTTGWATVVTGRHLDTNFSRILDHRRRTQRTRKTAYGRGVKG